jgi:hypothetical protein
LGIFTEPLVAQIWFIVDLEVQVLPRFHRKSFHDIPKGVCECGEIAMTWIITFVTILRERERERDRQTETETETERDRV